MIWRLDSEALRVGSSGCQGTYRSQPARAAFVKVAMSRSTAPGLGAPAAEAAAAAAAKEVPAAAAATAAAMLPRRRIGCVMMMGLAVMRS